MFRQKEKITAALFLLNAVKEDAKKFTAPQLTTTSKAVLVQSIVSKIELAEEELQEAMKGDPVDVSEDSTGIEPPVEEEPDTVEESEQEEKRLDKHKEIDRTAGDKYMKSILNPGKKKKIVYPDDLEVNEDDDDFILE